MSHESTPDALENPDKKRGNSTYLGRLAYQGRHRSGQVPITETMVKSEYPASNESIRQKYQEMLANDTNTAGKSAVHGSQAKAAPAVDFWAMTKPMLDSHLNNVISAGDNRTDHVRMVRENDPRNDATYWSQHKEYNGSTSGNNGPTGGRPDFYANPESALGTYHESKGLFSGPTAARDQQDIAFINNPDQILTATDVIRQIDSHPENPNLGQPGSQ